MFASWGVKFKLINISNRGTQVWPTGSVYTNLVNQYNVRFESIDDTPLKQQDVLGLYVSLSGDFKICSSELLLLLGGKRAYSLAQGHDRNCFLLIYDSVYNGLLIFLCTSYNFVASSFSASACVTPL